MWSTDGQGNGKDRKQSPLTAADREVDANDWCPTCSLPLPMPWKCTVAVALCHITGRDERDCPDFEMKLGCDEGKSLARHYGWATCSNPTFLSSARSSVCPSVCSSLGRRAEEWLTRQGNLWKQYWRLGAVIFLSFVMTLPSKLFKLLQEMKSVISWA